MTVAMIPVKIADTDDAPVGFGSATTPGKCATCTLCGHAAAAPLVGGRKPLRVVRDALNALARTCPGEAVHCYYPDRLPAGVRLEYAHRGRRLPCHLIGRTVVGAGGAIAPNTRVYLIADSRAAAVAARRLAAALRPRVSVNRKTQKKTLTPGYDTAVEAPAAVEA